MFFSRTDFTIITLTVFIMEMPPFVRNANFNTCLNDLYDVGFIYTTGVLNYKYKLVGMKEEDVIKVYLPGQLESLMPSKDKYYSFNQYNGRSADKIQALQVQKEKLEGYPRKYAEELELTTLNAPRLVRSAKTWCAMKICQEQEVKEFKFESDTKDYTEYFKATALKLTSQGEKEALCLLKVCYDELIDIGFIYDNGLSNYEAFIRNKSITPVTVKSFTEYQQEYINRFYNRWFYISPSTFCVIQACWDELEKYGVKYFCKIVQLPIGQEVIYTAKFGKTNNSFKNDGNYLARYYDHIFNGGTTVPEIWCGIQVCLEQLHSVELKADTGFENEDVINFLENTDHFPEFALLYKQYLDITKEVTKWGSAIWCENSMTSWRYNYKVPDNSIDILNDDSIEISNDET